jgi:hypothetical protein
VLETVPVTLFLRFPAQPILSFAFFSVESVSCRCEPGDPAQPSLATPIAEKQERIESTMEVPLKQTSQPPAPEERPGQLTSPHSHPPVWAQRLLLVVEVAIAVWAGMLVMVLPWTRLWTENPLLAGWPTLKFILGQSSVRGMISGIGLVDVWMGISDAVHYRDLR